MFTSALFVATAALTGFASAQNASVPVFANGANYSTSGPIAVPPNDVPAAMRQVWCNTQQQQCPQICGGNSVNNTCDPDTLTYSCICPSSPQPNISDYEQTLPGQECRFWFANCIASHPDDPIGQSFCKSVVCGMKKVANTSSTSSASSSMTTSMTASMSSGSGATGASATTTSSSSTHSSAATAIALAKQYGTPLMAGGMLALFGLAL